MDENCGDAPSYDHEGKASWSCFACARYLSAGWSDWDCAERKLEDLYMVGGADVGGNAFFLRRDWEDEEEGTRSGCVCANYPRPPPFSDWLIRPYLDLSLPDRGLSAQKG